MYNTHRYPFYRSINTINQLLDQNRLLDNNRKTSSYIYVGRLMPKTGPIAFTIYGYVSDLLITPRQNMLTRVNARTGTTF